LLREVSFSCDWAKEVSFSYDWAKEVSWSCPWAYKSLSCVTEHRSLLELSLSIDKSLSCVIEQLVIRHYILVELSLEVQGGQDYFRFMEGTCIIACVLSFSVLLLLSDALRLLTQSDSELLQTLNLGTVFQNVRKKSFWKHNSTPHPPPPPSCGFSHLQCVPWIFTVSTRLKAQSSVLTEDTGSTSKI